MTENEAINVLKMVEAHGCLVIEAKVKAIQALEEIQQYRAIGTVEDIREVMALCKSLQETVCKYMDIGTIDDFKALKEKNEPKKPNGISKEYGDHFGSCPICNRSAINYLNMPYKYCPKCGQALDWQ